MLQRRSSRVPLLSHRGIDRNDELMLVVLFVDEVDGIDRLGLTSADADKPDEWLSFAHGDPQGRVVEGRRIGASPLVAGVAVRSDPVVVGPEGGIRGIRREDRERGAQPSDLSDAALPLDERQPTSFVHEGFEIRAMDDASGPIDQTVEVGERRGTDQLVLGVQ